MYLSKAGIAVYAARLDGSASRLQSWLQLKTDCMNPRHTRRARVREHGTSRLSLLTLQSIQVDLGSAPVM